MAENLTYVHFGSLLLTALQSSGITSEILSHYNRAWVLFNGAYFLLNDTFTSVNNIASVSLKVFALGEN